MVTMQILSDGANSNLVNEDQRNEEIGSIRQLKEQVTSLKQLASEKRRHRRVVKTKAATKLTKEKLIGQLGHYISGNALKFVAAQLRLSGSKRQGYRWSDDEKTFASQMYHASPKCYKLLRRAFALPSRATLHRLLRNLAMKPGFNEGILDALKIKVDHMKDNSKICSLVFDEMPIKEGIH